ncbi:TIGR02147 family protein [Bdellovibrio sp. HCB290]|uniref:TIGR02147 family protein n=1 Tax=Bdellovibrio sp. HCB290 TaxID=3394356 RepID=UPI0039B563B9
MISPLEYQEYQPFLRDLFASKVAHRNMSLRSFARIAGISHSYLSRVMNSQKTLSIGAASKISQILDMSPEEEAHLMRLVAKDQLHESSRSGQQLRARILKTQRNSKSVISQDSFKAVAEWHHFAILALLNTKDFKGTAKWIGERLGIPQEVAKESFARLVKMGFIVKENGKYVVMNNGDIQTPHDVPSQAVRENHRQHLHLAALALTSQPTEQIEFQNASIPILKSDIPKAKKRLRLFMDQFIRDLEKNPGEEVYQINLQFYGLSQNPKKDLL